MQLHAGFTFDDAASIVPYLDRLGVSHLYTSPILQAAPGSMHGYDVIDHGRVNEELGGEAGFLRLTDALAGQGMGLVVDIVPNHMAIAEGNRWWWDVLEHGQASRYARWFDVDWDPPESRLRNVILLPVLPDHYGRVLEAGGIRVVRDAARLCVEHDDRRFPLDPRTIGPLVADAARQVSSDELAFIGEALAELPPSTASDPEAIARRQRDADVLGARLAELVADRRVARALDAAVRALAGDLDRLDALLDEQNYRLARWRSASRDLGYRRFFDIDELVGLRMEEPEVFAETHRLVLDWVRQGRVQGLRVDHPDGLRDPAGYFRRLREAAPEAWIIAEKILEPDEPLPADWPIDGTTGYRFANLATGMLIAPRAEAAFDTTWERVADGPAEWRQIADEARIEALTSVLGSDLNRLADLFVAVCEANRRFRDFTRHELHEALREVAVRLPVYRTYATADPPRVRRRDADLIDAAARTAAEARPDLDGELFALVAAILRLEVAGPLATELALRFQQLTPAAMAKGVEDTAFYRHHRLSALNEVGGDPGRFGTSLDELHARLAELAAGWPRAMLALSTHDTKRSADVRARLAILTHDADGWARAVERLSRAAAPFTSGEAGPTPADTYLFLQTVVGAWPIDADRAAAYMAKATHEAKLRTSWTAPDSEYDGAMERLVRGAFGDDAFTRVADEEVARIDDAWHRAVLVQQALHLLAPGVPDVYQGTELPDLSLVDPDNRRPVDYGRRRRLLEAASAIGPAEAWSGRRDGLAKLWLIGRALDLRRRRPSLFATGAYRPLEGSGDDAVAFARGEEVVGVLPLAVTAAPRPGVAVTLPAGRWRGLDGDCHEGTVSVADLVVRFPVAVLEREA